MLHGRVLRPDDRGRQADRARRRRLRAPFPASSRSSATAVSPASSATTEARRGAALTGLAQGRHWSTGEPLPDENDLAGFLKASRSESTVIDTRAAAAAPEAATRTLRRQYTRPYIAHASIAPSCAMAQWNGDRVHVWTHSQGVYLLRADLALVLKLPAENITVEHMEGAGCYGHNAADDVALDAVLLAQSAGGRPVRVQWSRDDEMSRRAVWRGDGDRDRGRSRCRRRDRRLAPFDLEQRPRGAAGARGAACAAGGIRNGNSVPAHDLDQSAAGQWRRRRSQLRPALRLSVLDDREPSPD